MTFQKDEIYHFRRALEDASYYSKKIMGLNQKIDYIKYEMTGLARHSTLMSIEQENSLLPLPRYSGSGRSYEDRLDQIDSINQQIERYRERILECETIERLNQEEKGILLDAFVFHKSRWDLAEKFNLCRSGLQQKINSIIKKCL